MLRKGAMVACVGLALLAAGCSTLSRNYLRDGVGTDVASADIVATSDIQDIYFGEICRQASLSVRQAPNGVLVCDESGMPPGTWNLFVQAGMNDIDRRCDAYLAWLDDRRRWREPFLKQLHSTAAVTAAIMGLSGVGATPIAIVGAAFGFAQETFVNLSGRLITEINQSTVQSLVMNRQNAYRAGLSNKLIPNRPAALYALRSYLRICMPMTIETEINTTMTGVDANGVAPPPMITPRTIAAPIQAIAPRETIRPPQRNTELPSLEDYKLIVASFDPKVHTISRVESALVKLCVPGNELRAIGETAKLKIRIYQQAVGNTTTGLLTTRDIARINSAQDCTSTRLNYFEANLMPGGVNAADVIGLMNLVLANGRKLGTGASVADVRSRIPEIRATLGAKLALQSPLLSDQFTSDLAKELVRLSLQ